MAEKSGLNHSRSSNGQGGILPTQAKLILGDERRFELTEIQAGVVQRISLGIFPNHWLKIANRLVLSH